MIGKPFKKGQSGNPGGRPKVVAEIKELARKHTGKAIETLVSIMANPKAAPAARVSAANALLDRGYGRPAQHITGDVAASYVARLPTPCVDVTEWTKSLDQPTVSPRLAVEQQPIDIVDKSRDSEDVLPAERGMSLMSRPPGAP
jgi:Family of unknown function (DUF5681)